MTVSKDEFDAASFGQELRARSAQGKAARDSLEAEIAKEQFADVRRVLLEAADLGECRANYGRPLIAQTLELIRRAGVRVRATDGSTPAWVLEWDSEPRPRSGG